jgi:hypothetical protein
MNHDYAHCMDYTDDCPKDCFRAELVIEALSKRWAVGWAHFKGNEPAAECREYERQKQGRVTE